MDIATAAVELSGRKKGQYVACVGVNQPQFNKSQATVLIGFFQKDYTNLKDIRARTRKITKFNGRLADQSTHYNLMRKKYDPNHQASNAKYASTDTPHVYKLIRDHRKLYLQIYAEALHEVVMTFDGEVAPQHIINEISARSRIRTVAGNIVDDEHIVNYRHLENILELGRFSNEEECLEMLNNADITAYY